jgi:hypothetical protein
MKTACLLAHLIVLAVGLVSTSAFAPKPVSHTFAGRGRVQSTTLPIKMGFGMGDEERKKLTRDSEPEDYFRT